MPDPRAIDPADPEYRINALAFNALTAALSGCDIFIPLSDRAVIARKVTDAVRAEIARQVPPDRLDELAGWFDDDDEFKTTMFPETWPALSHELQDDLRRWAALLREDGERGH